MSTKFALREKMAANLETAFNNAGMQRWTGTDEYKPKYWRGKVNDVNKDLFLLYDITDNLEDEAADNKSFRRSVYANGQLYTRSGFSNSEYQSLAELIETECEKLGIIFVFADEGIDTSIDADSPIYYCNFEAEQRLLV